MDEVATTTEATVGAEAMEEAVGAMASISGPTQCVEGGGGGGMEGRIGVDDVAIAGAAWGPPASSPTSFSPSTTSSTAQGVKPAMSPLAVR